MAYLLAWGMALAKNLPRRQAGSISEIAQRVGYGSAMRLVLRLGGIRVCRRRGIRGRELLGEALFGSASQTNGGEPPRHRVFANPRCCVARESQIQATKKPTDRYRFSGLFSIRLLLTKPYHSQH